MILANHGIISSSGGVIPSTLLNNLYAAYNSDSSTIDSLNIYNGTAIGGLTYGSGKINNAFQFNGTNSVVELPSNSMNFTGNFSFSFFVNMANTTGQQCIFSNEGYAGGQGDKGYVVIVVDGKLTVRLYNVSLIGSAVSTTTITASQWYHFVVVKDGQQIKIYTNGNLETTWTFTGSIAYRTPVSYPGIGALYKQNLTNSLFFLSNGSKVDAFNIWNREITQLEVNELYNLGNAKQYPF